MGLVVFYFSPKLHLFNQKYSHNNNNTVSKISIEHVTIIPSKYISKGAVNMKFSPDVGNNPSSPYSKKKKNNTFGN